MTSPFSGGDIGIYNGVTPDTNVNSLVWRGFKWGQDGAGTQATVTFSFPSAGASWINDYFDQEPFDTFQPFTLAQQAAARNALALWSDVANITFVRSIARQCKINSCRLIGPCRPRRTIASGAFNKRTSRYSSDASLLSTISNVR